MVRPLVRPPATPSSRVRLASRSFVFSLVASTGFLACGSTPPAPATPETNTSQATSSDVNGVGSPPAPAGVADEPAATAGGATSGLKDVPQADPAEARLTDAEILDVLHQADVVAVANAQALGKRGKDAQVRALAQAIEKHHTKADRERDAAARKVGIAPSASALGSTLKTDGESAAGKLRALQNKELDDTFLAETVRAHQQLVTLVDERLVPSATNEDVKKQVLAFRTAVAGHLEQAKRLSPALAPPP